MASILDQAQAVALNAMRRARCVAGFLDLVVRNPPPGVSAKPLHFPLAFRLGLGAAFQLLLWENKNIFVHRNLGLPSAKEAFFQVFRYVPDKKAALAMARLWNRVSHCFVEHLAWASELEINADIVLGPIDEDIVLEALADFLWRNRHLGVPKEKNHACASKEQRPDILPT